MRSWSDYKKTIRDEDELFTWARNGNLERLSQADLGQGRLNMKNAKGYSALMLAASSGHLEVAIFLLDQGADPNSEDLSGSTVLMGAAFKGDLSMVKLLISRGARIDALNSKNQTALDFATMFDRTDVADYLGSMAEREIRPREETSLSL